MRLPDDAKIFELIDAGAIDDARDRILELRQAAVTLAEENLDLQEQIITLKGELAALRGEHDLHAGKETGLVEDEETRHGR